MKKISILLAVTSFTFYLIHCTRAVSPKHEQIRQLYISGIKELKAKADRFFTLSSSADIDIISLRNAFKDARFAYKRIEFLSEYYFPTTSKAINGAPIPEVEADNPKYPVEPGGFQVIEELIFADSVIRDTSYLVLQSSLLQDAIIRLEKTAESLLLTDAHIWDALRLELFRIETLGISGYDSPIAKLSLFESAEILKSCITYLLVYDQDKNNNYKKLTDAIQRSIRLLESNISFDNFDRASFIRNHMNKVTSLLNETQKITGIPYFTEPRPLAADASNLFDSKVWNAWYYSTNYRKPDNSKLLEELGASLFYEPLLSGNNMRTCASCHIPEKAFTDGLTKNKSFDGKKVILRNTPSILFSALQPAQFADTRVSFLEDQAKQVIENPEEMHNNLKHAAQKIKKEKKYSNLLNKTFGTTEISEIEIQTALAAFIRTKSSLNSRFDDYMNGDDHAVTATEIKGFNIFMGKAKCGTCHFMPLFNGTVPPNFLKIETEVLGVPEKYSEPYRLDSDPGKFSIIASEPYKNAFKTTTVRNVEHTAPYMHNGSMKNLVDLLEFYNKGGGAGLGLHVTNQTLPSESLHLTKDEQSSLIAFMKSLSNR